MHKTPLLFRNFSIFFHIFFNFIKIGEPPTKNGTPSHAQEKPATACKERKERCPVFHPLGMNIEDTNPFTRYFLTKNVAVFLEAPKKD